MAVNHFANVGDNTWINLAHVGKVTLKPEYQEISESRQMQRTTTISIFGIDGSLLHSITTTAVSGTEDVERNNAYLRRIRKSLGLHDLPPDESAAV